METCPRCLVEFYPTRKVELPVDEGVHVYAHDCKSGFIRPYPQDLCKECKPCNEGTELMPMSHVVAVNRDRKASMFRMEEIERKEGSQARWLAKQAVG